MNARSRHGADLVTDDLILSNLVNTKLNSAGFALILLGCCHIHVGFGAAEATAIVGVFCCAF